MVHVVFPTNQHTKLHQDLKTIRCSQTHPQDCLITKYSKCLDQKKHSKHVRQKKNCVIQVHCEIGKVGVEILFISIVMCKNLFFDSTAEDLTSHLVKTITSKGQET